MRPCMKTTMAMATVIATATAMATATAANRKKAIHMRSRRRQAMKAEPHSGSSFNQIWARKGMAGREGGWQEGLAGREE